MRKVPSHVSGSYLLIILGVLVLGFSNSDVSDVPPLGFVAAVGAVALGGVVLILHYLGWRPR